MSISFEISRRGFISALLTAPLIGCATGESATVRYRVIATVLVDGKFVESSSVMEVRYWRVKNTLSGAGGATRLYGETLVLDLKNKGTAFILPLQHSKSGPLLQIYEPAILTTFGIKSSIGTISDDNFNRLRGTRGRMRFQYVGTRLPTFIAFRDLARPETVYEIDPYRLVDFFPGTSFVSLEIETTDDPITDILATRLPWVRNRSRKTAFPRPAWGESRAEAGAPIAYLLNEERFFGDGSM